MMCGRDALASGRRDGHPLWWDLGSLALGARLEHAVRVGDQAFALECGSGEWMVPLAP